ncbi:ATP-binding protein [Lacinutrix neustonica]|uniref:histidine kinase n=1 Tax=Lacinutrix neustonica TaxID=2980107 RepID=A0A9E8MUE8_9FLAO|nr:ATP-binding protein [Lacinutrix neustonica]WAC01747.1 ATP-binding protein [Lacinutrix neustonica]
MKDYFSTTYRRMLALIAIAGIIFLSMCFFAFYFIGDQDKRIIAFLIIGFIITMGSYVFFYRKLIEKPLNLITNVLEKNDTSAIIQLQKSSKEFSYIGDLFLSSNQQKEELKQAKEKAEESELLKASFLTNLSHEIRTPMNAILGFSDLLNSQKLTDSEKIEYIDIIRRSGKNLVSIIDDLIEMSKIDTNQVTPNHVPFNLNAVLNDIKQTIDITIPKDKPLKVFLDEPKHPVVFQLISDETKLRQVIVNLINNAVKYTEHGTVNFGYKINPEDNALEFFVKDTGIGISEGEFTNIFSRFNRIQNDKTIKLSGLGLGLSISKAYIEMLGGKIWLESTENIGTTFSFTIPLKLDGLPVVEQMEKAINTVDKAKPLNILIAEDNDINFMLIKRVLSIRKYTVIRAKNGEEAVAVCREDNSIQLIIMDLKMPKMGGFEARKIIKTFKPYLPVIAHTAYSSTEINNEVFDAGFIDCITKPLDKTELFKVIDRIEHLTPNPVLV